MRRTKGVVGALRAGASSSSMALSSMASEFAVETLPRLTKGKAAPWVGDVPDKPSVEMDIRRRWSCAALAIGLGNGDVGLPEVLFDRPKMLLKVCVVNEPRRALPSLASLSLLLDILDGLDAGEVVRVSRMIWRDCVNDPQLLSSALDMLDAFITVRCSLFFGVMLAGSCPLSSNYTPLMSTIVVQWRLEKGWRIVVM